MWDPFSVLTCRHGQAGSDFFVTWVRVQRPFNSHIAAPCQVMTRPGRGRAVWTCCATAWEKGNIEGRELPNTKGLQAKGFYCAVLILVGQKVVYGFRADSPFFNSCGFLVPKYDSAGNKKGFLSMIQQAVSFPKFQKGSQWWESGGVGPLPAPPSWLPAPAPAATLKARAVSVPRHVVQGSRVVPPPVRISVWENDVLFSMCFWYLI